MSLSLSNLNETQKEAVEVIDGPLLILAGAGTGKTTTIVYRLAYLVENGIPPNSILTLTFTNKAASEMRERALKLIDIKGVPPLLCTFHKFGLILLRLYINKIERKSDFTVIDTSDIKKIVKNIIKERDLSIDYSLAINMISGYKNSALLAKEVTDATDNIEKEALSIYEQYEKFLLKNNLVDFDDLILLPYLIIKNDSKLNSYLSDKYRYIMIDEYQDTNYLQFSLIKLLTKNHQNLAVVGDDDQSIYSWRGANIENILSFGEHYSDSKIVKLEQNYRSSENILNYANRLIKNNTKRHKKSLKSNREENNEIVLEEFEDENGEARFIAQDIKNIQKHSDDKIAIVYRLNALSRVIEDALNRLDIAYQVIGNVKFYDRAEIKDILCYLRVIDNLDDDFSLERVINRPTRGIGNTSYAKIKSICAENGCSISQALDRGILSSQIPKKAYNSLAELLGTIKMLNLVAKSNPVELIDKLESSIKIKDYYKSKVDSLDKIANIDEFYALFKEKFANNAGYEIKTFLEEITLNDDNNQNSQTEPVSVMSIHSTKGLEFDRVYIIGLEEGFLPIISDDVDLEEERRLLYVAITRAKKHLNITYANQRFYKGSKKHLLKSRFISELLTGKSSQTGSNEFKVNSYVKHKLFGIGKVLSVTKFNDDLKLKIDFNGSVREILSNFVERIY